MKKKFLVVLTVNASHHVIDLSLIEAISPKEGEKNKSSIKLIGIGHEFYSIETPIQIFEKIKLLQSE